MREVTSTHKVRVAWAGVSYTITKRPNNWSLLRLAFVGVLEHYQQTICTLHALERGELLPFCDCTDKSQWSRFEGNYTIKLHRPTRQSDNRSDDGHDALIDELTRLDRKVYAAAVHRLRRDASRVERAYGVRLWCNE